MAQLQAVKAVRQEEVPYSQEVQPFGSMQAFT